MTHRLSINIAPEAILIRSSWFESNVNPLICRRCSNSTIACMASFARQMRDRCRQECTIQWCCMSSNPSDFACARAGKLLSTSQHEETSASTSLLFHTPGALTMYLISTRAFERSRVRFIFNLIEQADHHVTRRGWIPVIAIDACATHVNPRHLVCSHSSQHESKLHVRDRRMTNKHN